MISGAKERISERKEIQRKVRRRNEGFEKRNGHKRHGASGTKFCSATKQSVGFQIGAQSSRAKSKDNVFLIFIIFQKKGEKKRDKN